MAVSCDTVSQLEVVAEVIDQGFEAADLREIFLRRRHDGAEHEIDLAAQPIDEHTGGEIGAVAHGLETGRERAVGEAAVEARDAAHFRIAKRASDCAQKARIDSHIAIGDDHDFMACFAHHAAKFIYLVARAERLRANQQTNRTLGKIHNNFLNYRDGRIAVIGNAEENFEFRVILAAEACVILIRLAVEPVNRFENADRRSEIARRAESRASQKIAARR